jgi:hypothetical protein
MSSHEHFCELSALAVIGQLSSDEDNELRRHLRECTDCREVHAEYARVIQHQLPQADAIRHRIRAALPGVAPEAELRDRFMARCQAEGIDLSARAIRIRKPPSRAPRLFWGWGTALAVAGAVSLAVLTIWAMRKTPPASFSLAMQTASIAGSTSAQNSRETEHDLAQLAALQQQIDAKCAELDQLKHNQSAAASSIKQLQKELQESRQRAVALTSALEQVESNETQLAADNHQKDAIIEDISARNNKLHISNADNLATRLTLEAQVRDLKDLLQQETGVLERERQLSAVTSDVRVLMGARNLRILDVHDVDGEGKSARAFGRVFYAEGTSLIFYAFDLPSGKLSPAKYTFQAWAQREYVSHSVRNLGTFEVDDHEQRRWVMKTDDPLLLRDIDSVFVTAESLGDSRSGPRGKKLLYAYIHGRPNHP